jgi:hypothetical protein
MPTIADSTEWQELERELADVTKSARAFNTHVFDAWDNLWCSARGGWQMRRDDLADFVHVAVARARTSPLARGGVLDTTLTGRMGHAYLRTFGSCYVLLLRFSGPFHAAVARSVVALALPRVELLTLRLPPSGGPGNSGAEASNRA